MPSPRFENLDAGKREVLLEAARGEFAEYGFEGSSYNRIIANSGLSKGSFYYYFHGKEDLYLTVAQDATAKFSAAVGDPGEIHNVEEFWAECARMYTRLLQFGQENPSLVGVLKSMLDLRPTPMAEELMTRFVVKDAEWYLGMIQRGQELGAIRTDLPMELLLALVFAFFQAKGRVGLHRWLDYGPMDIEENANIMIDLFRRVAAPARPTDPGTAWPPTDAQSASTSD